MKSMIVVGDIHGCFDTLMALIAKFPEGIPWCSVGDLVDRGPRNRKVVDYMRENKIPCVKGNHELLMYDRDQEMRQCWMMNGGAQTGREYDTIPAPAWVEFPDSIKPQEHFVRDVEAFERDCKYMRDLPLYLEYPEIVREDGRHLLVSHTTIADFYEVKDSIPHIKAVWQRKGVPKDIKGVFNIYGHTPVEKVVMREHYADIDTGCVFDGRYGLKYLTALQFPEMIFYTQECIDFIDEKPATKDYDFSAGQESYD